MEASLRFCSGSLCCGSLWSIAMTAQTQAQKCNCLRPRAGHVLARVRNINDHFYRGTCACCLRGRKKA